jgi:hypothetical protein
LGVGRQTAQKNYTDTASCWLMRGVVRGGHVCLVDFLFHLMCVYAPGCLMWFFFFLVSYSVFGYLRGLFFLYLFLRCGIIGWASFFFVRGLEKVKEVRTSGSLLNSFVRSGIISAPFELGMCRHLRHLSRSDRSATL